MRCRHLLPSLQKGVLPAFSRLTGRRPCCRLLACLADLSTDPALLAYVVNGTEQAEAHKVLRTSQDHLQIEVSVRPPAGSRLLRCLQREGAAEPCWPCPVSPSRLGGGGGGVGGGGGGGGSDPDAGLRQRHHRAQREPEEAAAGGAGLRPGRACHPDVG